MFSNRSDSTRSGWLRMAGAGIALTAAVLLSGCAASRATPEAMAADHARVEVEGRPGIRIRVQNDQFHDLKIYIRDDQGHRSRLGTVSGYTTGVFELNAGLVGQGGRSYSLIADMIGGKGGYASELTPVNLGETAFWTVDEYRGVVVAFVG
jgi:hypothetical protein